MRYPTFRTRMVRIVIAATLTVTAGLAPLAAQVRAGRRGAVAKDDDRAAAAGPRGAAVKTDDGAAAVSHRGAAVAGEEGYAAAGRRGAVVSGEEGYAAVGRNGAVVTGEEVDVQGGAVGRRGAVVVGEEGAAAVGRYGGVVVSDNRYESYEAWRRVAAVGTGIAIGTMLAKPPAAATTVVVAGSTYYVHDNVYYTRVMNGGAVSYQVVAPPAGAISSTLPADCQSVRVGDAAYTQCGPTYYTKVAAGYQVVAN
jgi:Family of unknown function (DUF6515)